MVRKKNAVVEQNGEKPRKVTAGPIREKARTITRLVAAADQVAAAAQEDILVMAALVLRQPQILLLLALAAEAAAGITQMVETVVAVLL